MPWRRGLHLHPFRHRPEWSASGCKSIGRLCGARSRRREEARHDGCWQSGDFEGVEEALGEGQSASKESSRVMEECLVLQFQPDPATKKRMVLAGFKALSSIGETNKSGGRSTYRLPLAFRLELRVKL
jgi:hypothetical protein